MSLSSGNLAEYLRIGSPVLDEIEEVSSSDRPGPVVLVDLNTMGFQTVTDHGCGPTDDFKNIPKWNVDATQWDPDLMILRPAPVLRSDKRESQSEVFPSLLDEMGRIPATPQVSYDSVPVNRRCRVQNCATPDLLHASMHCCRHRICTQHVKMLNVPLDGIDQRFCQKCTRFHPVEEFDKAKHTCRKGLELQRQRRLIKIGKTVPSVAPEEEKVQEAKPNKAKMHPVSRQSRQEKKSAAKTYSKADSLFPGISELELGEPRNFLGKRGRAQLLDLTHFLPGLEHSTPVTFFSDTPVQITPINHSLDKEAWKTWGDAYGEDIDISDDELGTEPSQDRAHQIVDGMPNWTHGLQARGDVATSAIPDASWGTSSVAPEESVQEAKTRHPTSQISEEMLNSSTKTWPPERERVQPDFLGRRGHAPPQMDLTQFLHVGPEQTNPVTFFSETPVQTTPISDSLDKEAWKPLGDAYGEIHIHIGNDSGLGTDPSHDRARRGHAEQQNAHQIVDGTPNWTHPGFKIRSLLSVRSINDSLSAELAALGTLIELRVF
eukprot:1193168-Prorocentrum_minimum.AAC.2